MASLMPNGKQQFTSAAGVPLSGGKLFTYAAGTVTPKQTFSDAAGTVPNTNPIILDSRGEALIFWVGNYKVVLQDSLGNIIYTVDNYVTDAAFTQAQGTLTSLAASTGAGLVGFDATQTYAAGTTGARIKQLISGTNTVIAGTTTPTGDATSQSLQNSIRSGQSIYSAIIPAGYNFASTLRVTADQQPGSTVQHMSGVDIYTYNACSLGTTPNERNMVALFTDGIIATDNGKTWSLNTAISDNTSNGLATLVGRTMIGWEADFQVNGASTVQGISLFIQGAGTPANANAIQISQGVGTAQWTNGFITNDGSLNGNALAIGSTLATGANIPGQKCSFNYRDASNLARAMFLQANNTGMNVTSSEVPDGLYLQAGNSNVNIGATGTSPNTNVNLLAAGTGQIKTTTSMYASLGFQLPPFTVATLPAAAGRRGFQLQVTDSGAVTYRGVAAGGGTTTSNVTSDGVNWLYM